MRTRSIQQSFGGGRMSADMLGRAEDAKGRSGLYVARNVRTTMSGTIESRSGWQFVAAATSHARTSVVRAFDSSAVDSVVLAITGWDGGPSTWGIMRIISHGALVPLGSHAAFWTYAGSMVWTISPLSAGTPIRVTIATHGRVAGEAVRFTTTGVLPGPLTVGTTYYVRNVIDANTFTIAYEPSGAEVQYDGVTPPSGLPTAHRFYAQGDMVTRSGVTYTAVQDSSAITPGVTSGWADYWYAQGGTYFEIPHRYADAHLHDLDTSAIEGSTMTIVHRSYPASELVRESAAFWRLRRISFASTVQPPRWAPTAIAPYVGDVFDVVSAADGGGPTRLIITVGATHPFAVNEALYVEGLTGLANPVADGFYALGAKNTASTTIDLRSVGTGAWVQGGAGSSTTGTVRAASTSAILTNYYRVTSVGVDGRESDGGAAAGALNILEVGGSYNTLTWLAASGAVSYRIYRVDNGRYQFLDETTETTYRDVGDGTDDTRLLPLVDATINGSPSGYPGCAALFEGRRWLLSTDASRLGVWATRSGTSNDLTYHHPDPVADDRLAFSLRSRSNSIEHAIAQAQTLILLTDSEEIRVASLEGGALSALDPIPSRPVTRHGSTKRIPAVVGGVIVFESRGGRILELGFRSDEGWGVRSLSERTSDWFDGGLLVDGIAVQRAPIQTLWMCHPDGRMLGNTYAPEEQLAGWHDHDTQGTFESVCACPEGGEEVLYAVVQREVGGNLVRYFERQVERAWETLADRRYLDSFATYDGTNTTATTLTLTGGTNWKAGESITLTASAATFAYPATTDRGDQIKWLGLYRVRIESTSSTTVATGTILDDFAAAPAGPSAVWTWGRDTIAGLDHLEGKVVKIVADGVVLQQQTVAGGTVSLRTRAVLGSPSVATVGFRVHVGLGYRAEAVTMPPSVPIDGLGHGRQGSTTHVHLRMRRSAPFRVGPFGKGDEALNLTQEPDDFTGVTREPVFGNWNPDKQIRMVQDDPLPMVVCAAVYSVAWGD